MTENENETYYYDPQTGERVTATYLVTLVTPANYFGYVEVRAISQQEAGRLALDRLGEADWECTRLKLIREHIEVLEIECEDPPEAALLYRPSSSEADISAQFEEIGEVPKDYSSGSAMGGDQCK
jgi:hypothetical protein